MQEEEPLFLTKVVKFTHMQGQRKWGEGRVPYLIWIKSSPQHIDLYLGLHSPPNIKPLSYAIFHMTHAIWHKFHIPNPKEI